MGRITRFFRKVYAMFILFLLGLLFLYFKSKAGALDHMRAMLFLSLIVPLLFSIALEDAVRKTRQAL